MRSFFWIKSAMSWLLVSRDSLSMASWSSRSSSCSSRSATWFRSCSALLARCLDWVRLASRLTATLSSLARSKASVSAFVLRVSSSNATQRRASALVASSSLVLTLMALTTSECRASAAASRAETRCRSPRGVTRGGGGGEAQVRPCLAGASLERRLSSERPHSGGRRRGGHVGPSQLVRPRAGGHFRGARRPARFVGGSD
mmetsp:Transcript_16570/g.38370  ORF Transcript_16570/g.38370 Transcript_16570/m.38370 type:complete len:201 (-) Transcript_16570:444-1046(-)